MSEDEVDENLAECFPKQHAMVCAFITADEYQFRFSPVRTQSNADCR